MGEAKRKQDFRAGLDALSKRLADDGKIVEAGWLGLRAVWLHPDSPASQVKQLRWAFMAGAQHLFSSIMTIMEPGIEPTPEDFDRLDKIDKELRAFGDEITMDLPVDGNA